MGGRERFRLERQNAKNLGKDPVTINDSHGKEITNGEERFMEIMDNLDRSLAILARDERTQPLYYQAINDLTARTNEKLRRLGFEKGVAEIAGIVPFGPLTVFGGAESLVRELKNKSNPSVVRVLTREPITPKPQKPQPNVKVIAKETLETHTQPDTFTFSKGILYKKGNNFEFEGQSLTKDEALELLGLTTGDTPTIKRGLAFIGVTDQGANPSAALKSNPTRDNERLTEIANETIITPDNTNPLRNRMIPYDERPIHETNPAPKTSGGIKGFLKRIFPR